MPDDRQPRENAPGRLTGECQSNFAVAIADLPVFVEQAMKISHDAVIAATGASRRSGVQWTIRPIAQWRETMAELGIDVPADRPRPPQDIEVQAGTYPDGVLVVATVQIDPDLSSAPPPRGPNRAE